MAKDQFRLSTRLNGLSGVHKTMQIQARLYRDHTDLTRMRHLVMVGCQANIPASYMHPGSLDWATHYPRADPAIHHNLRLWEQVDADPPTLVAWAIFAHHEGSFDLFVHPTLHGTPLHETMMDEYVAWAETRARAAGLKKLWPFWAMEYDTVLVQLMLARGFVAGPVGLPAPLFERTLDELPMIRLPEGFTMHEVRNLDDGRLRAQVTHGAFSPNDDWEIYAAQYAQFIGSVVYDGARDLFVRSPDGRGASACTIWFDPVNAVGLFEPVGTHPNFQRQGLGKAVMAEGLCRMKAAGMRRAVVGFDPNNVAALALYTSMGFRASSYFTFPQKEL
jgi:ribosomal protein S18 acetylase RimI-like enzyme